MGCTSVWRFRVLIPALVWAVVCFTGCASDRAACRLPDPPAWHKAPAVVYVANGAGDWRATSQALEAEVEVEHAPLLVEPVLWSHGHGRVFADQLDGKHARQEGERLAAEILRRHQKCPELPIHLLGHSAGSAVVLAAAEHLPPGTVGRIILLAPSVPARYDLRPALRCARDGIDVFWSPRDWWYPRGAAVLSAVCCLRYASLAAYSGFKPVGADQDGCYAKLRQYSWQPSLACLGNDGGHYGCYQRGYLRFFVLPLLCGGD